MIFIATASLAVAALLVLAANLTGGAKAQVNCETIPAGPARTDCYTRLSRISRQKGELPPALRSSTLTANLQQVTGSRLEAKRHRAASDR